MISRSLRTDVRNPVTALPAMARLMAMPDDARDHLAAVLYDLAADAQRRAEHAWRTRKAPLAAYLKVVAVYARHIARAIRRGTANAVRAG